MEADAQGKLRTFRELLAQADLGIEMEQAGRIDDVLVTSVTDDSRAVRAGSCFVALAGTRCDGAAFVADAVRRGAAAVVSEGSAEVPESIGAIRVLDARTALARLAAAYYGFAPGQRFGGMKLIGVTGTNGKSTTAILLRAILEAAGERTALLGTIHYDLAGEIREAAWTTPPPVALYEALACAGRNGATHAVMEVSSHALAQSRCDGHRFGGAVFTNLSGDHLDYHGDMAAYAAAKKRLFDMLDENAWAVVNADDLVGGLMVSSCRGRVTRFGLGERADVVGGIESSTIDGCTVTLGWGGEETRVRLGLVGRHSAYNALAAAAAALAAGIGCGAIRAGLESVRSVRGRLERVASGDLGVGVFVDYAHTDDALVNVLEALRPLTRGRLICVFGCGGDRDRTKRPRMGRAVFARADAAVVTSDNPRSEAPLAIIDDILRGVPLDGACAIEVEADRRGAIERAIASAEAGDTVLIAGKGHETYQIVGDERRSFCDVTVASEILAERCRSAEKT